MTPPAVCRAAGRLSAWLLAALVFRLALPAYAQTDVPSNWPLKPADLDVGDEFRLLLMARNGRKADSTDIADYDAFVQEIIGRIGHAHIREYASNFKVLASTATVDARDHTGTRGVTDIPTYWLNGPIVATSYSDLFDGAWPNKDAATLQDGVPATEARKHQVICTGSTMHGEATAEPLGADTCTGTTIATTAALGWLSHPKTRRARYLALSDVFRVGDFTDATVPTIAGVEITSDPGSDGEYVAGDAVEVTVTFSESVTVTGTPLFRLTLDTAKRAGYVAADSTATELVFSYTVTMADHAHDGINLPRDAVELNGGTIQDQAGTVDADLAYQSLGGQFGHRVYIPPTVSGVSVASTPNAHGIYSTGETIQLDLTWDRKIAVFGSPLLHFFVADPDDVFMGAPTRTAAYTTTIGDHVTRFEYEVQAEDADPDGISLIENGNIEWNGAHIIRQGHGDHADKDSVNAPNRGGSTGLAPQAGHRVNVVPPDPLTASFEDVPADHDGSTPFRLRLLFSAPIATSYRVLRDQAVTATDGAVTGARRVDQRSDLWEITVQPSATGPVTVTLAASAPCGEPGAVCTADNQALANAPSATIQPAPEPEPDPDADPLTASFEDVPSGHDGATPFGLRLLFSAPVATSYRVLRDQAVTATGGAVTGARRVDQRGDLWEITVEPSGAGPVTVTLATSAACGEPGAVCTADNRALSNAPSATIQALPELSVADAEVEEAAGAMLVFAVTLDRAWSSPVTVDWRINEGSATAGEDYIDASGTLTFDTGETAKTVSVEVLDDTHDEEVDTLVLRLSNATGARILDGVAVGIIRNADPMPQAWLAHFGRAAADHTVQAIAQRRLDGPLVSHVSFGGGAQRLGSLVEALPGGTRNAPESDGRLLQASARAHMDRLEAEPVRGSTAGGRFADGGTAGRRISVYGPVAGAPASGRPGSRASVGPGSLRDMLMGSSFHYSRPLAGGRSAASGGPGRWSAWGSTAATRFRGADGPLSLDGEVATATLGFDRQRDRWLAGLAVSYSEGKGLYAHDSALGGGVASTQTSVHPYARFALGERTKLWAVLGYGLGALTLTPRGSEAPRTGTDTTSTMAALGARSVLSVRGRFELAVRSDAQVTNTVSESVAGLSGAAAATSRARLMLQGAVSMPLATGGELRPRLEAGMRHDGGDAGTGAGLEIGGGLAYSRGRLSVKVDARGLVAQDDTGYVEWGVSGLIGYRPHGDGRGLALELGSSRGAVQSGVQSPWSQADGPGMARGVAPINAAQRLRVELGYGLTGPKGRALWIPYVAADAGGGVSQALRLGLRLNSGRRLVSELELGWCDTGHGAPEHALQVRGSVRW